MECVLVGGPQVADKVLAGIGVARGGWSTCWYVGCKGLSRYLLVVTKTCWQMSCRWQLGNLLADELQVAAR